MREKVRWPRGRRKESCGLPPLERRLECSRLISPLDPTRCIWFAQRPSWPASHMRLVACHPQRLLAGWVPSSTAFPGFVHCTVWLLDITKAWHKRGGGSP